MKDITCDTNIRHWFGQCNGGYKYVQLLEDAYSYFVGECIRFRLRACTAHAREFGLKTLLKEKHTILTTVTRHFPWRGLRIPDAFLSA